MTDRPRVQIVVDSRVRVRARQVSAEVLEDLRHLFTHENPVHKRLTRERRPVGDETPFIRTWRDDQPADPDEPEVSFPRGGYRRVVELLHEAGYATVAEDRRVTAEDRTIPDHRPPPDYLEDGPLWPHQEAAVVAATAKQNCLIRAGTGSGKTSTALALIGRLKQRALVVVSARNLMDQWVERVEKELGIPASEVGIIGGGKRKVRPVTVALQQSLAKHIDEEWLEYFGLLLYDEVQEAAARTVFAAVDPWPAKYRVGVSADETRKDRKEFLIYDLFGSVAAEAKQRDLIASGVVVDVEILVVPTSFDVPGYKGAMMSRNGFARRAMTTTAAKKIAHDPDRRRLAVAIAKREADEGQQVFVFTEQVDHALLVDRALMEDGVQSGLMIGGQEYLPAFRATKEGLRAGNLRAGVGTLKAIGKGTDFPKVGTAVLACPLAGNRQQFGQVRGRVCRSSEGKLAGRLYYLWDRRIYGKKAIENLASWYRGSSVLVFGETGDWIPVRDFLASLRKGA